MLMLSVQNFHQICVSIEQNMETKFAQVPSKEELHVRVDVANFNRSFLPT